MRSTPFAMARLPRSSPADLVSLRTTVLGTMRKPPRHTVDEGQAEPLKEALRTSKDVYFRNQGFVSTPVFKRASLRSGNRVEIDRH